MALKTNRFFITLATGAAFSCLLLASSFGSPAHAGFEWVPAKSQKPELVTAPESAEAPDMLAPMPGMATESVESETMMPMPLSAEEQNAQPTASQLVEQAPVSAPPQSAPASAPQKMKIIETSPPQNTAASAAPAMIIKQEMTLPPQADSMMVEEKTTSEPQTKSTKVIMADDAPAAAMENTPGSEKLMINPRPDIAAAPADAAPQQEAPESMNVASKAAYNPSTENVMGFGSDMPLALALQQVVPSSYAVSFGARVNPGTTVSWSGGKPWEAVVGEMIGPLGLTMIMQEHGVHITQAGAVAPVSSASSAAQKTGSQNPAPLQASVKTSLDDIRAMPEPSSTAGSAPPPPNATATQRTTKTGRTAITDPGPAPTAPVLVLPVPE